MAALKCRTEARQRLQGVLEDLLDRFMPADEMQPLRGQPTWDPMTWDTWGWGRTFGQWEDQADEFDRTMTAAFVEELATLDEAALAEQAGRCPHCSSTRVSLDKSADQVEIQSQHGRVVIPRQTCRCRSCDRTFSPSSA